MVKKAFRSMVATAKRFPVDKRILVARGAARNAFLNRQLAVCMSFVAGALNAGGFLAFGIYTSHITGSASRAVDEAVLGNYSASLVFGSLVFVFCMGAFFSGLLISLGQRRRFRGRYAFSLLVQSLLLALFAWFGSKIDRGGRQLIPELALSLSFLMGMHNSLVTTISGAEIRTTHMTGNVTDIGIELSRLFYFNRSVRKKSHPILANRTKLKMHLMIVGSFVGGAFFGAWGFKKIGYSFAGFFAVVLLLLAIEPVLFDLKIRYRLRRAGIRTDAS